VTRVDLCLGNRGSPVLGASSPLVRVRPRGPPNLFLQEQSEAINIPGFGDQRESELLVEAGFRPFQAIRIATLNGAIFRGSQD
jgi:hypothetical protein